MQSIDKTELVELMSKREALMQSSKPPHPGHAAKLLGISDELYHHLSRMSDGLNLKTVNRPQQHRAAWAKSV